MHIPHALLALALGSLPILPLFGAVAAQDPLPSVPGFDPDRAILNDEPWFDPFHVTERDIQPLAATRSDRVVGDETPLLVLERGGKRLALLIMQMSYHHVAQGKLAGSRGWSPSE